MRFKRISGLILSFVLIFNICGFAKDIPTYDYMWENKSKVFVRLSEEGVANVRINEFLNALDSEVDSIEPTEDTEKLKQYFLVILFNVVLMNEDFADVCGAFDIAFQEELTFMAQNNMKLPPAMQEFFEIAMSEKINPPVYEEFYPVEEEILEEAVPIPPPPPVEESVFSDVSLDFWAYPHILSLYEKDIVSGYGDKIFRPMANVTRAELAKIVCKAFLNEKYKETLPYTDVGENVWYRSYAEICEYYSLFSDIRKDTFCGNEFVTRQEMCTVIYRALLNSQINLKSSQRYEFSDKNLFASYAVEAVEKLQGAGIINGYGDYKFHPNLNTTRSEMCKVIDMLLGLQH